MKKQALASFIVAVCPDGTITTSTIAIIDWDRK